MESEDKYSYKKTQKSDIGSLHHLNRSNNSYAEAVFSEDDIPYLRSLRQIKSSTLEHIDPTLSTFNQFTHISNIYLFLLFYILLLVS